IPVGNSSTPFTGNFVGQSYAIKNLYINQPSTTDTGLFGVASGGTLGFVNLINENITGYAVVGTLAGIAQSGASILNSTATGSISSVSSGFLGGLVGVIAQGSSVNSSYTNVALSGTNFLGGITAENGGSISNSYSTGSVTGSGNIGGLVGTLDNTG